jgi:hypothetical protein
VEWSSDVCQALPRSAGGASCMQRPTAMSTLTLGPSLESTGADGACSSAHPSTVSIAPATSGDPCVPARSSELITAVEQGRAPVLIYSTRTQVRVYAPGATSRGASVWS